VGITMQFCLILHLTISLAARLAVKELGLSFRQQSGLIVGYQLAWLVEGAHGSNMDKRANVIQALGLDSGDPAAVQLAEDALGDKETYVSDTAPPGHSCQTGKRLCAIRPPPECFG